MRQLIIVIFALWGVSSFAQNGFFEEKVSLDSSLNWSYFLDVLVDNDTIVYYGVSADTNGLVGIFFSKMDSLGNIIAYNSISDTTTELSSSVVGKLVSTPNGYAMYGTVGRLKPDTTYYYYQETYMIKVSHNLDLEFIQFYPFPQFQNMLNFSLLSTNNGFYLFGTEQYPDVNAHDWYVIKTDAQGNLLWKKSYFKAHTRDFGTEMFWLDDNTIILYGESGDDLPPGGQTGQGDQFSYPMMLAIDTFGNVKWDWNWNGDKVTDLSGGPIMPTPDGGYVYGSAEAKWQQAGNLLVKPVVIKMDSNFQEEWRRYIDTVEEHLFGEVLVKSITMSKDGNYIVSGGLQLYIYHGKFSPQGDRIWARYDSTWVDWIGEEEGMAEGTAILSSGSIVSGGRFTKLTPAGWTLWSFIMKLSPDGCMDTLACWPVATDGVLAQNLDYQLDVYPNPADDVVHFSLSQDVWRPRKAEIIISDVLGRKVGFVRYEGKETSLDVHDFPQGLYFYRLEVDGRMLDAGRFVVE